MTQTSVDREALKQTLKEALSETLHEERELLHEVFAEVLEDFALGEAIRGGLETPPATREDVRQVPEDQYNAAQRPLMINSFFARTTPDTMLYEWYHSTGSWNRNNWRYSNPEVDKILDTARQTGDVAEQKRLYGRFQEIAATEGPGPVLFVVNHAEGVSNRVHGFSASRLSVLNLKRVTVSD